MTDFAFWDAFSSLLKCIVMCTLNKRFWSLWALCKCGSSTIGAIENPVLLLTPIPPAPFLSDYTHMRCLLRFPVTLCQSVNLLASIILFRLEPRFLYTKIKKINARRVVAQTKRIMCLSSYYMEKKMLKRSVFVLDFEYILQKLILEW